MSLVVLTGGIAMVQLPSGTASSSNGNGQVQQQNKFVGLMAVTVACVISGLAGVYFEKVLKGSKTSIWARNVQLSFLSLIPAYFLGG